jgi:hypothetical protein
MGTLHQVQSRSGTVAGGSVAEVCGGGGGTDMAGLWLSDFLIVNGRGGASALSF